MSKPKDIRFLEFIEPQDVIIEEVVITEFMVANFKEPPHGTSAERDDGSLFLKHLLERKLIFVIGNPFTQINVWEYAVNDEIYKRWWNTTTEPVKVTITDSGIEYLNNYRLKEKLTSTNQSIIDTNEAVKKNIATQIILGIVSVLAIVITAIIAVMAYYKPDSENLILIRKAMQRQDSILQSIQQSQKERNTFLMKEAKKNSPKKP
jgi:hypothetical protein